MVANPASQPQDTTGGGAQPVPEHFDASMAELEAIVQKMEAGSMSLEESVEAYRRGAELIASARRALAEVEQQVRILEADVLKPFDTGAADEA
jgi:exodeoxyribonuclease VII small subunit